MVARTVSPEFIGRTDELARAVAILEAVEDAPSHLLVAGEAGIGKTRFTRELEREAVARGIRVLRGGCVAIGGVGLPYAPFAAALRAILRDGDPAFNSAISARDAAALGQLVPGLTESAVGSAAGPTGVEAPASRAQLFEALLEVLRRLAATAPVLLIVEDVHWADPATRDAITFLVPNLVSERVHLTLTFRSDELDRRNPLLPWLAELGRNSAFERLDLERFSRDETARLVATIIGSDPAALQIDRLQERSDGNAFFIEELLLAGGGGISVARLPPTVRATLIARIEAVPETAHRVLRVAAVAGRRVDHEVLAAVAGLSEADLTDGLRAAIDGQLLVPDGEHGAGYAFRHALVQETAYDDLLPGERRVLHRAYAEALASRTAPGGASAAAHWAELAHHWGAGRDDVRAAHASIRAGDAAVTTFAFAAAQRQYETALELWDGVPDPAVTLPVSRVDLLARAARAAELNGDAHRMADLLREAIGIHDPADDPVGAALLHESRGRALWLEGDTDAALTSYGEALRTMPADEPTPERGRVLAGMGQILMLVDRFEEALAFCNDAEVIARAVGDRRIEGHALNSKGFSLAVLGWCEEGVAALEAALVIARDLEAAEDVGRSYVNLTDALRLCGLDRDGIPVIAAGIEAIDGMGMRLSYGPVIRQGGSLLAFGIGDWELAEERAAEARRIDRPGRNGEIYALTYTIGLAVARGDPDVSGRLDRFGELLSGRHEIEGQYAGQFALAAAEHALWSRRPVDALGAVDEGLRWIQPKQFHMYACLLNAMGARAEADLAESAGPPRPPAADTASVIARIDVRIKAIEEATVAHAPELGGRLDLECAHRAAVAERSRAALASDPELWRAAADAWADRVRPYEVAQARWREAEAFLQRGDRTAAKPPLLEAWSWAVAHGAGPLLAEIEALARRSRIGLAPDAEPTAAAVGSGDGAVPRAFGLTRREGEVLALLVEGQTNRQIADRLFITENTAGVHVSNILGKLGAASRTEAAAIAHRLGLVDSPGESVG